MSASGERPGQYVRDYYGVPAFIGARVTYEWNGPPQHGKITGFDGQYLMIRFDDGSGRGDRYHPTWHITYGDPS